MAAACRPFRHNLKPPAAEKLARQARAAGDQIYTCERQAFRRMRQASWQAFCRTHLGVVRREPRGGAARSECDARSGFDPMAFVDGNGSPGQWRPAGCIERVPAVTGHIKARICSRIIWRSIVSTATSLVRWGGPPGPRPTPPSASVLSVFEEPDQGSGAVRGGPPHRWDTSLVQIWSLQQRVKPSPVTHVGSRLNAPSHRRFYVHVFVSAVPLDTARPLDSHL